MLDMSFPKWERGRSWLVRRTEMGITGVNLGVHQEGFKHTHLITGETYRSRPPYLWGQSLRKRGHMHSTTNPGRVAGLLYVLTSVPGVFAMVYVPSKLIVAGSATATANNLMAHERLFRLGIAAQLVSQIGFIFVALALYDLLKGVNQRHASLMLGLIVVSVPIAMLNELNSMAALMLARGADFLSIFDKPQRDALAMLFLNLHNRGFGIAEIFWGLWLFPLAWLVYRSRFLPRLLGVWLALGGFAYVILSLTSVVLPQYQGTVFTYSQPAMFGEVAFMLWLLIKGARPPAMKAAAAAG